MSRWAIVDNNDPSIVYSGNWLSSTIAGVNDAFQGTVTSLNVANSQSTTQGSLTFSFEGTSVAIFGPFSSLDRPGPHATWECFIDGNPVASNTAYGAFPWESYCLISGLNAGKHVLTLNVTSASSTSSQLDFLVDFIRYIPSQSTPDGTYRWMLIESNDLQFNTNADGWVKLGTGVATLFVSGAPYFTGNYTGTSVAWYSLSASTVLRSNPSFQIDPRFKDTNSQFEVIVDDGSGSEFPPTFFADTGLNKLDPHSSSYNEVLFKTPTVQMGSYTLIVDAFASLNMSILDSANYPMITLDYLIVDLSFNPQSPISGSTLPEVTAMPTMVVSPAPTSILTTAIPTSTIFVQPGPPVLTKTGVIASTSKSMASLVHAVPSGSLVTVSTFTAIMSGPSSLGNTTGGVSNSLPGNNTRETSTTHNLIPLIVLLPLFVVIGLVFLLTRMYSAYKRHEGIRQMDQLMALPVSAPPTNQAVMSEVNSGPAVVPPSLGVITSPPITLPEVTFTNTQSHGVDPFLDPPSNLSTTV